MKKSLFILLVTVVSCIVSGCYDMVDIEDICAVSAIFVDSDSITYCTVNASPDEKKYSYTLYTSDEENLYQGINILSEKTGNEISLSHMEAIMFSVDCSHDRVKENINALLGRTNTHPKSLVAYYEGTGDVLADKIMKSAQNGGGKYLRKLLDNRFSGISVCNAVEFCYGVNYDGSGSTAPVISSDSDNIIFNGIVYANTKGSVIIPRPYSDIVTAVKNCGKDVCYGEKSSVEIKCVTYDAEFDRENNRYDIRGEFACSGFGADVDSEVPGRELNKGMEYIVSLKDNGFDVLDIYTDIRKSFLTISSFENYVASRGGAEECVRKVDVSIRTSLGGEIQ